MKRGFVIIPSEFFELGLKFEVVMLLGKIWALSSDAPCFAGNSYFMELFGVGERQIERYLADLKERKLIVVSGRGKGRSIEISEAVWGSENPTKMSGESDKNVGSSRQKCREPYNRNNNTVNNTVITGSSTAARAIFDEWNRHKIIEHRNLTEDQLKAIAKALKKYNLDTIIKAIDDYSYVLSSPVHWFSHEYRLEEFLNRGLVKFIDESRPRDRYREKKGQAAANGLSEWAKEKAGE